MNFQIIITIVLIVAFLFLIAYFKKAKCPKCGMRFSQKKISEELLEEFTQIENRHEQRDNSTYNYDVEVIFKRMNVTYECQKCNERYSREETKRGSERRLDNGLNWSDITKTFSDVTNLFKNNKKDKNNI